MTNVNNNTLSPEALELKQALLEGAYNHVTKKSIYHSGNVKCGGGKTESMLHTLAGVYMGQALADIGHPLASQYKTSQTAPTTIVACKTTDLAAQSNTRLQEIVSNVVEGITIPTVLISNEVSNKERDVNAVTDLINHLKTFKGVIFCTHAALGLLNQQKLLEDKHVIIDEVPSHELAGVISLSSTDEDGFAQWDKYIEMTALNTDPTQEPTNGGVFKVSLREGVNVALSQQLEDRELGIDTAMSDAAYRIFFYLLNKPDVEVLYRRKKLVNTETHGVQRDRWQHIFEAVDSARLVRLYQNAMRITFLAASFESSLIHYLSKSVLGYNIVKDDWLTKDLEANHTTNIVLLPVMKDRNWSKYLLSLIHI